MWQTDPCLHYILSVPRADGDLHLLSLQFSCHYSGYIALFCWKKLYLWIAQQDEEHALIKYFSCSNRWCATLHYPGKLLNSS